MANGSAWPIGDALTPLARALEDPDVAAAGAFGLTPRASPAAFGRPRSSFRTSAMPARCWAAGWHSAAPI